MNCIVMNYIVLSATVSPTMKLWSLNVSRKGWQVGIWLVLLSATFYVESRIDFSPLLNLNNGQYNYCTKTQDSLIDTHSSSNREEFRQQNSTMEEFSDGVEKKHFLPMQTLSRLQGTHQLLNRVLHARDLLAIPSLMKDLHDFNLNQEVMENDNDESWFLKDEQLSKQVQLQRRSDLLLRNPSWNRRVISIRFPPVSLVMILQPARSSFHHNSQNDYNSTSNSKSWERTFGSTSSLRKVVLQKEDPTVLIWDRGLCIGMGQQLRVTQQLQSFRQLANFQDNHDEKIDSIPSHPNSMSVWTLAAHAANEIHRETLSLFSAPSENGNPDVINNKPISELLSQFYFLDLDTFAGNSNNNNSSSADNNTKSSFNLWLQGRGLSVQIPGQVNRHDTDFALGPDSPLINEWFRIQGNSFRRMLYQDLKRQRVNNMNVRTNINDNTTFDKDHNIDNSNNNVNVCMSVKETFTAALEHLAKAVISSLPTLFTSNTNQYDNNSTNNSTSMGEGWEVVLCGLMPAINVNETEVASKNRVKLHKMVFSGEEFVQLLNLPAIHEMNLTNIMNNNNNNNNTKISIDNNVDTDFIDNATNNISNNNFGDTNNTNIRVHNRVQSTSGSGLLHWTSLKLRDKLLSNWHPSSDENPSVVPTQKKATKFYRSWRKY